MKVPSSFEWLASTLRRLARQWRVARAALRELAAPGSFVDCYKVDRYERRVCRLKTEDGQDAADLMLSESLGWCPEDFASEDAPLTMKVAGA
jgi:endonuclease YncB( thermonuclease family)